LLCEYAAPGVVTSYARLWLFRHNRIPRCGWTIMTFVMTRPVDAREVGPLEDAPLRLALVQARTAPVLPLERAETIERLLEVLDGWELVDRQSNVELAVRLGPGRIEQQQGQPETVWIVASPTQQFRAVLSPSSVAVECDRYSLWPDFSQAVLEAFGAVAEVAAPTRCVRLGMRYVNELRDDARLTGEDPQQLAELLADELITVPVSLGRPVLGSLSELRVREDFGVLAVRHGLVESGRYLLDMDAYNEEPRPFEVEGMMTLTDAFHRRIESFFAWALAPSYLASLSASASGEGAP
jgi:uncharacterized protein (TIGR04255 family)